MKRLSILAFMVVAVLAFAAPAWASSPSNVSVKFGTSYPPQSTSKAGAQIGYQVMFTSTSALSGGTQANDSITLSAPAGTVFPTGPAYNSPYNLIDETTGVGYGVNASPILSNNGATVAIPLANNSSINIRAGDRVTLDIGLFGPYVTNPTTAGSYTLGLNTSRDTTPANSTSYTITPNDPASVSTTKGDGQSVRVDQAFATPLSAKVTDAYGNAISGQSVTFAAPSSGPGGAFSGGGATAAATTDGSGVATAPAFTANSRAGSYTVTASSGSLTPATFNLTNLPGPVHSIAIVLNPASIAADGASTSTATATVTDADGNGVPGETVKFVTDGGQAIGASRDNGDGTYTAEITSTTTPGDSTITATDYVSGTPYLNSDATLTQVDGTPPDTTISSGPSGTVDSPSASFAFSSEPGARFECSLDGSSFTGCASPKSYASLSDGSHTFRVRATDAAGNTDPTPARRTWTVDTTAPNPPAITSPGQGSHLSNTSFRVSGTAEPGSSVELFEGASPVGKTRAGSSGNWSVSLSGVREGSHAYTARATDAAGNTSSASAARTVTVDTTAPTIKSVGPANLATGVSPGANVTATFSEAMRAASINRYTVKLYKKGSTTPVAATVSYSSTAHRAVLNPANNLRLGATYRAVVTTGVRDQAGNHLAQSKVWYFTIKR